MLPLGTPSVRCVGWWTPVALALMLVTYGCDPRPGEEPDVQRATPALPGPAPQASWDRPDQPGPAPGDPVAPEDQEGRPERSIEQVKADLLEDPHSPELHAELGSLLVQDLSLERVPVEQREAVITQAREPFERAYKLDPRNLDAAIGLARLFEFEGHPQQAREYLEYCLSVEPTYHYCKIRLAAVHLELGSFEQADTLAREVLVAVEGRTGTHERATWGSAAEILGMSLMWQNKTDEAERWLAEAKAQVSTDASVSARNVHLACPHVALGQLYRSRGSDEQAAQALVDAAEYEPYRSKTQYLAARQLYYNGELERAAHYVERALAIEDKQAYRRLREQIERWREAQATGAGSLPPEGRLDEAVRAFMRMEWGMAMEQVELSIAQQPSQEARTLRGLLLVAQGQFEEAERVGNELRRQHPDATGPRVVEAHVALGKRDHARARTLASGVIEALEPEFIILRRDAGGTSWLEYEMARLAMGWSLATQLQHERAIAHFDAVLIRRPSSLMALLGRGNSLNAMGEFDRAEEDFQRVEGLDPGNAFALAERGLVQLNRGEVDGAAASFEAALAVEPDGFTCPLEGLGMVYVLQDRQGEAATMLESAIETNPDIEYEKYNQLAKIRMQEGDFAEARRLLEQSLKNFPQENEAPALLEELDRLEGGG